MKFLQNKILKLALVKRFKILIKSKTKKDKQKNVPDNIPIYCRHTYRRHTYRRHTYRRHHTIGIHTIDIHTAYIHTVGIHTVGRFP